MEIKLDTIKADMEAKLMTLQSEMTAKYDEEIRALRAEKCYTTAKQAVDDFDIRERIE